MGAKQSARRAKEDGTNGAQCSVSGSGSENSESSNCPVMDMSSGSTPPSIASCPASPPPSASALLDASGQSLNPTNMMPTNPKQEPAPGQRISLPTGRQPSSIPQAGTESTWSYPSQQMFFNALQRKGKGEGVSEKDMSSVVTAHNSLNETTWREVLKYESLPPHGHSNEPELKRFMGKSDVLSPLAYAYSVFGYGQPFDRHDWIVTRNGERDIRYVIDFYHDSQSQSNLPFSVNVRPALDSFEAVQDRLKLAIYTQCYRLGLPCPVTGTQPGGALNNASASLAEQEQQRSATA